MSHEAGLHIRVAGLEFQNPIVLAAGTAGYGSELDDVMDLGGLGGFVTKAVSREPRAGAPAPRVADFAGGMINAVGLANPGVDEVCSSRLPWMAAHHPRTRKLVNVVGFVAEEFANVIAVLDGSAHAGAIDAYELNVSCPNTRAGGLEFGADDKGLRAVVTGARAATRRPLFVKLSPTLPDIARTARVAVDAGADGITVVNTLPGLLVDVEARRPVLGFGTGGVSGSAILPVGVLAAWRVSRAVSVPVIGVGGVRTATDALQYILAGASLVGMGTAALRDPRQPARVVRDLARWCRRHGVRELANIRGTLTWPE
ncbi:MAG TPA: dihydroorotate dehydrogenase [Gemmatimonadaceae bacterium]|jgi:dihydroorotate dehydrogenase (NAD+) catalytic subunit|nr:dihydroorotate dehydrogenase [Gemmatimonadaceae bacterium]